ncbi:hypothetical protein ACF058_30445 [Streptomyces sp. NPDC015501]|uniref:hypothetical protein n=1 Tax=unclassified Streptomyces TaxID=2593676 RepID=UPI00119FD65F|nr:hypothetical protein A3L22_29810 [Streptomyces griseus subsp. griseus]
MDEQAETTTPQFSTWPQMKIARASQHLADLRARINLWATSAPYTVEPRISNDRTTVSFFLKVAVPPPTDEWSLYLGDALHALRSALDACVWELAHLNGQAPSKPRMVAFPDCRTEADWNRVRRDKLQTVPDLYAERIKQTQPFSTHPQQPNLSALAVLSYLDNQDKHRASIRLNLDGHQIEQSFGVKMAEGETVDPPLEVIAHFVPFEDGAVLLETRHAGRIASVSGSCNVGAQITFDTELGCETLDAMDMMIIEVYRVLAFIRSAQPAAESGEPTEEEEWQEMTFVPSQDGKTTRYAPER